MSRVYWRALLVVTIVGTVASIMRPALAIPLRAICRVEGQEDIVLQGLGIVTGLKGTGDGGAFVPTIRALATALERLGSPVATDALTELKDAKNVALVVVSARVPPAGARRGDRIDCTVSAISAKSLEGGRLFLTPLTGPVPMANPPVFALAEGMITVEDPNQPTVGKIFRGCRFIEDFRNSFVHDGNVLRLAVRSNFAGFAVTQEIADVINSQLGFQVGGQPLAKAIDQVTVEVSIPQMYQDDVVNFVAQVMNLELIELQLGPRVVINEQSGSIVIGDDVQIGPVVVTHKNLVVEAGYGTSKAAGFVAVDTSDANNPKLKSLVEALNALRVPPEDIISIIKAIHQQGKLYGQLIIE